MVKLVPYVSEEDVFRWIKVLESIEPKVINLINAETLQGGRQIAIHFRNALNSGAIAYALDKKVDFLAAFGESLVRFDYFFRPEYKLQMVEKYISETCEEVLYAALICRSLKVDELIQKITPFVAAKNSTSGNFAHVIISLLSRDFIAANGDFREISDGSVRD